MQAWSICNEKKKKKNEYIELSERVQKRMFFEPII